MLSQFFSNLRYYISLLYVKNYSKPTKKGFYYTYKTEHFIKNYKPASILIKRKELYANNFFISTCIHNKTSKSKNEFDSEC